MTSTINRSNLAGLLALLAGLAAGPLTGLRAQPAGQPQQYIYVLRVAPPFHDAQRWSTDESAVTERHFARLARATQDGRVILAGRTGEPLNATFGVVIFEAENDVVARQFMEADPAVMAGLMSATLHPYTVALQRKQRAN